MSWTGLYGSNGSETDDMEEEEEEVAFGKSSKRGGSGRESDKLITELDVLDVDSSRHSRFGSFVHLCSMVVVGLFAGLVVYFLVGRRNTAAVKQAIIASGAAAGLGGGGGSSGSSGSSGSGSASSSDMSFAFSLVRDGYTQAVDLQHEFLKYAVLDGIDVLIEPYVNMRLQVDNDEVSGEVDDGDAASWNYVFSICSEDDKCVEGRIPQKPIDGSQAESSIIKIDCVPYSEYVVTVVKWSGKKELGAAIGKGMCMYVRREIRTLLEDDLATTMSAMHTLWTLEESQGQSLYGSDYHDALYFVKLHYFGAAWADANHIADGTGFLPQHVKITTLFEKAMQAVDRSVSLPYWDFTIEAASGTSVENSYVFSPLVFGSARLPSDTSIGWTYASSTTISPQDGDDGVAIEDEKESSSTNNNSNNSTSPTTRRRRMSDEYVGDALSGAAIPDGLWANTTLMKNEDTYPDLKNGYDFFRSPWNMNPSPYVSRFIASLGAHETTHFPSCRTHASLLDYSSLMDYLSEIESDPVSNAFALTGGVYGCSMFQPLLDAYLIDDNEGMLNVCLGWPDLLEDLYRGNAIAPTTGCETSVAETTTTTCPFECADRTAVLYVLQKSLTNVPELMSTSEWNTWVDFVCGGDGARIFGGDMTDPSHAADPLFWVIIPTLDKLTQAKMMSGGFRNTKWSNSGADEYVCEHAKCYEKEKSNGKYEKGYFSECCYGHYENDQLLDAINGEKSKGIGPKNTEMLAGTDPSSSEEYDVNYIYDDFTWSHCRGGDVYDTLEFHFRTEGSGDTMSYASSSIWKESGERRRSLR